MICYDYPQGNRPAQLSYAGDPVYRKTWKQYVKFRHLLNSKPKVLPADKAKLKEQEERLREYRMKKTMKREVSLLHAAFLFDFLIVIIITILKIIIVFSAIHLKINISIKLYFKCLSVILISLDYEVEL